MGQQEVDVDALTVGDTIPSFLRTTGFEEWNRYAAVNDEFVPIHMDDEAGRAAGNERGAFGMGNLRRAYLLNMLHAWAGDDAEVRRLVIRYKQINQKHDVLRAIGRIRAIDIGDDEGVVLLDVDVVDGSGSSTTPGEATVVFRRGDAR
jgi:acyl dehydratase